MTEARDPARTYADYDIRSPFRSYLRVCRDLIVEPEAFFLAVRGGLWGPTFFVFVTHLLSSLLALLIFVPVLIFMVPRLLREYFDLSSVEIVLFMLVVVVAIPLFTGLSGVFNTLMGDLIWHPIVAVSVGIGRGHGFRETYRIGTYQSLPYVLGSLGPFIGILVALGRMAYVGVLGVKGAHGASLKCSIISVAIPLILLLFIGAIVTVVIISSNASR